MLLPSANMLTTLGDSPSGSSGKHGIQCKTRSIACCRNSLSRWRWSDWQQEPQ